MEPPFDDEPEITVAAGPAAAAAATKVSRIHQAEKVDTDDSYEDGVAAERTGGDATDQVHYYDDFHNEIDGAGKGDEELAARSTVTGEDRVFLKSVPINDDDYSQYTLDNLSGIIARVTTADLYQQGSGKSTDRDVETARQKDETEKDTVYQDVATIVESNLCPIRSSPKKRFRCTMRNSVFCSLAVFVIMLVVIGVLVVVLRLYDTSAPSPSPSSSPSSPVALEPPMPTSPTPTPSAFPGTPTSTISSPGAPSVIGVSPTATSPSGATSTPTIDRSPTDLPSKAPSTSPTSSPITNYMDPMMEFLQDSQVVFETKDPFDPAFMAVQWLNEEANESGEAIALTQALVQRFAVLALDFALNRTVTTAIMGPNGTTAFDRKRISNLTPEQQVASEQNLDFYTSRATIAQRNIHECNWDGIVCRNNTVVVSEVRFSASGLQGTIPAEIGLLSGLEYFDVSVNEVHGSLPDKLYDLSHLRKFYAYQNKLTGTLSDRVEGKLYNLTHWHLSTNQLSGSIPAAWKSGEISRPLLYFNVYDNQLTGTIPEALRFRSVRYFDVGRNQLDGTLPIDLGTRFVELRHLFLDHNAFNGTLPESYINVGNGRLESLGVDHNRLTGVVPSNHDLRNHLVRFTLQNNSFTRLSKDTCSLSVYNSGEIVEFKADCDICICEPFCALYCSVNEGNNL